MRGAVRKGNVVGFFFLEKTCLRWSGAGLLGSIAAQARDGVSGRMRLDGRPLHYRFY
jgi:hypothetical protein